MNHYEFFGIPRDASDDEIKNAYKRMAKKYHPDVSEGCSEFAHEKMQKINELYGILSNDALREEYDYSLWLDDRAQKTANYANEFGDFVPRDSRFNPEAHKTPWQKYYEKASKKSKIKFPFDYNIFKPKSKKARRIMMVVRVLRLVVPAILIFVAFGLVFRTVYMAEILDNIYGRGTPAQVTAMFFNSIKEGDFERTMSLARRNQYDHSTAITSMISMITRVYGFEHEGVPYGQIWFNGSASELRFKVQKTERFGFDSANVTVEITNLNTQKIFVLAQHRIMEDLRKGTWEPVLWRAVYEQDFSLIPQVYGEYMGNIMKELPNEYITVTLVLLFSRPFSNWIVRGADDIEALRNVILGGLGDNLEDYTEIDWIREMGIFTPS